MNLYMIVLNGGKKLESIILKYLMIILCLLLAELGGFCVGFQIKNHINLMKQNRYKFFETVYGILRLNTCSGEVKLILPSKEDKIIFEGRRFSGTVKTYDIVNTGNLYLLVHTSSGYFSFLNI